MQILERFTKLKQKDIPKELEDYLSYVAKTGDTVYTWSNIKYLFREKLMHVIKDFHDTTSSVDDLPQYPNVDPFNYETMKSSLLERLELFSSAPFTVQRLCELLTDPKKQYSRIDKYMRALEKNILVVSTIEPGRKQPESENGDSLDSVVNGDLSLDVNIDVEIDMANEAFFSMQQQLRNNATSSANNTTTITSPNNKPATTTDDDIDAVAGQLLNSKKMKLELEKTSTTATTVESTVTTTSATIPNNQTSTILKEQKTDNAESSSDDSDSQESREEINKNCESTSKIIEQNNHANDKTEENKTEKLEEQIIESKSNEHDNENKDIVKNDSMTPRDIVREDEILSGEINENKENEKLTEDNDEPLSAEEEDKLLNVDDDLDNKPSEIENRPITEEVNKSVIEDDSSIALKGSGAGDDNIEKEFEKNESEKANQSIVVEEKSEKPSEIETQIQETDVKSRESNKETIPSQTGENIENTKILEKMSVEDVAISAANVSNLPVTLVENVTTSATVIDVPTQIVADSIPLEVDVQTAHTDGQIDQPMEDSVTDEIVMQISETEMATDVELSHKLNDKPDLTGMDVDDTSQEEAMDQ